MERSYREVTSESRGFNETNDCTVVAVAIVTGKTYPEAHKAMADAGRKRGRGAHCWQYEQALNALGFTWTELFSKWNRNSTYAKFNQLKSRTIRTVERELADNWGGVPCLIKVSGHLLAWNGSKIEDYTQASTRRVQEVWAIHPTGTKLPKGKKVAQPEQRKLYRPPMTRSAVLITCDELNIEQLQFRSVKAAYDFLGLDLKGHQSIRREMKLYGKAYFDAYYRPSPDDYERWYEFKLELADMSQKECKE